MKNKKKICVVINNRANYARIKSFLLVARKNKKIDLQIITAGSSILAKYGSIDKILKKDGLKTNLKLHTIIEGNEPICIGKNLTIIQTGLIMKFFLQHFLMEI